MNGLVAKLRRWFIYRLWIFSVEFGDRCAEPDFGLSIDRKFIRRKFISRTNTRIRTIIGEVAYSQSLDNLLMKSRQYIMNLSIDIVIAVDRPQPTMVKGRIGSSNGGASYTRSRIGSFNWSLSLHHVSRWFNRVPIPVSFDQEFIFQLKTDSLRIKNRDDWRVNFEHQLDVTNVTVLLDELRA